MASTLSADPLTTRVYIEGGGTNAETARVLDLQESAASKRYIRALRRLREILNSLPGGLEEMGP